MKKRTMQVLAGVSTVLVGYASEGHAQSAGGELARGASVLDRPRPELDPLGVRAGGFLVFPQVEAGVTYESNVFARPSNEDGDFIFVVQPEIVARSDFSRHAITAEVGAEVGRYADFSTENYEDYRAALSGRYDVGVGGAATAGIAYAREHEGRGDPDLPFAAAEPVEYSSLRGDVGYSQRFNRVTAGVGFAAERLEFDDVAATGGGTIAQDTRDRWQYDTSLRLGYEIQPSFEAFVRGTYSIVDYQNQVIDRNSKGYEIVVGSDFDLTGLVTGTVYAGYLTREFDNAAFEDVSGPAFGLDVYWAVTQLTTVRAYGSRSVQETTAAGARERTRIGLGADHELLRNLIFSADLTYQNDDFSGATQEDDLYRAEVDATYILNRNLYTRAGYAYETRDSNVAARDYDNNILSLRVGARL
ncbi:outer membrane beta-barrel protein [Arenibaculum sp.]|uniref:outer membrane beta-barrel protein n=1 Tax=Arenibaculum sp. TaxID=2865862 RepID=UPI002E0FC358|nr:outer membrane beta-barrel protein [Arenibaculum sp.]